MSERRILRMGNPNLHKVSEPVADFDSPELDALVMDLWHTMEARGGIGLAAPQVGVGLRVVVFGMESPPDSADAEAVPRTVLINPEIELLDGDMEGGWEGCLSLPGFRGLVPRHRRIRYRGSDARGRSIEREAEGFHARVVQHECDHLDGVLYPQRMTDLSLFGFEEEISLAGRFAGIQC